MYLVLLLPLKQLVVQMHVLQHGDGRCVSEN